MVFAVERILERADLSSAEGKDLAIRDLAPALAGVPESVLLDELRRRIAGALGIPDTRLATLLASAGSGGGRMGPPPSRYAPEAPLPVSAPPAVAAEPVVRGGAELGVNTERAYLAMCLAGGEAGRAELARIDPEKLFTSAVLRRAVRRLTGQMEISPGVVAITPVDPSAPPISDEQVSRAIDDLERRAARASRTVVAEELEHARLLLELARVERQLQSAKLAGAGAFDLAWQRDQVREALKQVVAKLERPL